VKLPPVTGLIGRDSRIGIVDLVVLGIAKPGSLIPLRLIGGKLLFAPAFLRRHLAHDPNHLDERVNYRINLVGIRWRSFPGDKESIDAVIKLSHLFFHVRNHGLPPEVAEGLEETRQSDVALQKAQLAADARRADEAADAAAVAAEPLRLYVKRGGRHYASVVSARLKPGEPVYVRQPDGLFECIGETDARAQLRDLAVIIT
jgi:hypothetical protein